MNPPDFAYLAIGVGLVFLALEIFTPLPTFGVAGALGVGAVYWSLNSLLHPEDVPLSPSFWTPSLVTLGAFLVFLGWKATRALRMKNYAQGFEELIGQEAEVVPSEDQALKVRLRGEIWNARWAESASDTKRVKIVARAGFVLLVRKA